MRKGKEKGMGIEGGEQKIKNNDGGPTIDGRVLYCTVRTIRLLDICVWLGVVYDVLY